MHRRLTALFAAGTLALLGACGDDDNQSSGAAGNEAGSEQPAGEGGETLELVLASAGRAADAGTSRFEFAMAVSGGPAPVNLVATGASDNSVPIMALDMDLAAVLPGAPAGSALIQTVYDGKAVYMKFPEQLAAGLPAGKRWARMDLAALSGQAGIDIESLTSQFNSSDPMANIALLSGAAGDITEVGTEDVRGVSTRHLKMTVDLQKATDQITARITGPSAGRLKEAVSQAAKTVGVSQLPMEAWIGEDGLPRRISYDVDLATARVPGGGESGATGTAQVRMEFFDYGQAVNITVPPAEETFDFAEMMKAAGGQ